MFFREMPHFGNCGVVGCGGSGGGCVTGGVKALLGGSTPKVIQIARM